MPTYSFNCLKEEGGCGYIFEVFMCMSDYNPNSLPTCPQCQNLISVKRDFQADLPTGKVVNKTLGSLAEQNTLNMSDDARLDLWRKHNAYKFDEPEMKLPKGAKRIRKPTDLKPPKKRIKRKLNDNK